MRFFTYATLIAFSWLTIEVAACKNKMNILRRTPPAAGQMPTAPLFPFPNWLGMKRTKEVVAGRDAILIYLEGEYHGYGNPVMKYYHHVRGHLFDAAIVEIRHFQKRKKYIGGGRVSIGDGTFDVYALLSEWPKGKEGVDWSYTRHPGLPESPECVPFRVVPGLPSPPIPYPEVESMQKLKSKDIKIPDLENSIIKDTQGKPKTWRIDKANYVQLASKRQVVQVSWLENSGDINLFKTTTSYLVAVNQFIGCGFLEIAKDQWIAYLVMKFEGELENWIKPPLTPGEKQILQSKAREGYKSSYGMLSRGPDTSFSYIVTGPKKEAFIYEWSRGQREDLGNAFMPTFMPSTTNERQILAEISKLYQEHHDKGEWGQVVRPAKGDQVRPAKGGPIDLP